MDVFFRYALIELRWVGVSKWCTQTER